MVFDEKDLAPYHGDLPFIFLSYSHKNADEAKEIIRRMNSEGFRVWYDEGLIAGTEWDAEIASNIERCSYLVALISKDYIASQNCRNELLYALNNKIRCLPIYLEETDLPKGMALNLVSIRAVHKKNHRDLESFYKDIFAAGGMDICRGDPSLLSPMVADIPHTSLPELAYSLAPPKPRGSALLGALVCGLSFPLFRKKDQRMDIKPVQSAKSDSVEHTRPIIIAEPPAANTLRTADVEFSALFPKRLTKGEHSILEMYIYEKEQRKILDEALKSAGGTVKESHGSTFRIGEESIVSIFLESSDTTVQIEGNNEYQVWYGGYLRFDFSIFLEESYAKRQLMFTATVLINNVPATRLRFLADCNTLRDQKMELLREDILSAFVSYASQDRSKVAMIIQGMKKARPEMDVFFDVDSLRSGEDWQRALRAEIERRDILFLCWSLSAKQSEWVDREWRYALENKGLNFIEPVPLDPPNICPPPKELSSKHFNDRRLLYIDR